MGILQARILEWVAMPSPREIFPIQRSNPRLHCRQILYHLSHQGNPRVNSKSSQIKTNFMSMVFQGNTAAAAIAAKSLQSCPTLCDWDSPGKNTGVGCISFSNAWKWKVKVKSLSRVQFLATPWTAAHQAPPSMGFSRQEYWSGVPLPPPREILENSKDDIYMKIEFCRSFSHVAVHLWELWGCWFSLGQWATCF